MMHVSRLKPAVHWVPQLSFVLLSKIENELSAMTNTSLAKVLSYLTLENVDTFLDI